MGYRHAVGSCWKPSLSVTAFSKLSKRSCGHMPNACLTTFLSAYLYTPCMAGKRLSTVFVGEDPFAIDSAALSATTLQDLWEDSHVLVCTRACACAHVTPRRTSAYLSIHRPPCLVACDCTHGHPHAGHEEGGQWWRRQRRRILEHVRAFGTLMVYCSYIRPSAETTQVDGAASRRRGSVVVAAPIF